MAFADCCFSFLSSTVKFRYSVSCLRRLVTSTSSSHASVNVLSPKAGTNYEEKLVDISDKSNAEKDSVLPGRWKDEKFSLYANETNGRGDTRYTQSTGFKSYGMHRKDKEFKLDSREQQVHLQTCCFRGNCCTSNRCCCRSWRIQHYVRAYKYSLMRLR